MLPVNFCEFFNNNDNNFLACTLGCLKDVSQNIVFTEKYTKCLDVVLVRFLKKTFQKFCQSRNTKDVFLTSFVRDESLKKSQKHSKTMSFCRKIQKFMSKNFYFLYQQTKL